MPEAIWPLKFLSQFQVVGISALIRPPSLNSLSPQQSAPSSSPCLASAPLKSADQGCGFSGTTAHSPPLMRPSLSSSGQARSTTATIANTSSKPSPLASVLTTNVSISPATSRCPFSNLRELNYQLRTLQFPKSATVFALPAPNCLPATSHIFTQPTPISPNPSPDTTWSCWTLAKLKRR